MYSLIIHKKAVKFLNSRNPSSKRIIAKKLELLKENPYSHPLLDIKKLKGIENVFRLRIGTVRIIYQVIKNDLLILVISAGGRGDIYNEKQ
jgi:mRNA interferase RelE/StbE